MARPHHRHVLLALVVALAACGSSDGARAEFIELTGIADEELECVEELADADDPSPFGVMPDCVEIDRLRVIASNMVGSALDFARENGQLDDVEALAEETGLDLDLYQECLAENIPTLDDREIRVAFAAPTSEELGERLAEPFVLQCVGVARDDPTLGFTAVEAASLLSGAIGRVDARLQTITVPDTGSLRVHLIGDPADPIVAIPESPSGEALSVQVILTGTRLADAALEVLGDELGFDPPTATNLTVTGSRELTGGLVACVLENPASVTIRPGPRPCDE